MLDEVLESPAFWILGIGGVSMEVLGYIIGKNMGFGTFPMWQFIVLIIGTLCAAAFFALQD